MGQVEGSGTGEPESSVKFALTPDGSATEYTVGTPLALPSISKVNNESAKVGSLVVISDVISSVARRKKEISSGDELGPGAFWLASIENEMVVPNVNPVRYSLNGELTGSSLRITVPGRVPITIPVGDAVPRVPSVAKPAMETAFCSGPPPLMKSTTRSPVTPFNPEVSIER
jgi:hypothetical protein